MNKQIYFLSAEDVPFESEDELVAYYLEKRPKIQEKWIRNHIVRYDEEKWILNTVPNMFHEFAREMASASRIPLRTIVEKLKEPIDDYTDDLVFQ